MSEAFRTMPTNVPAEAKHEDLDIQPRPVVIFGGALVVVTVLVLLIMSGLFSYLTARRTQMEPPLSPLASTQPQLPPEPRLQVTPAQELRQLREAEETILRSYGWVDQAAGIVRLPIERAIELLAERGLPTRPAAPPGEGQRP